MNCVFRFLSCGYVLVEFDMMSVILWWCSSFMNVGFMKLLCCIFIV